MSFLKTLGSISFINKNHQKQKGNLKTSKLSIPAFVTVVLVVAFAGVYLNFFSHAASCNSFSNGDLDCSGKVDITDLSKLLTNYGKANSTEGDVNSDSKVDITDLSILLSNYGKNLAVTLCTKVVSPRGSDGNDGSLSSPYHTVDKLVRSLTPGQTGCLRAGTYLESINTTVAPGTANNKVLLQSYPGERAVIQGKFWLQTANFWTIDNVNVTWGAGSSGTDHMVRIVRSHDWRYTNSELWGAHSTAAFGINSGQYNFQVDHNYIHDTFPTNNTNQDHLIYVETDITTLGARTGIIERNILVGSPNGRAIKIGKGSGETTPTGGVIVRYNTMADNLGPSNIQLSYGAAQNEIYRNIMVHSHSGYQNVTRYNLVGTGNNASNNIGWQSTGVIDIGTGLTDGGGNLFIDPQLDSSWHPKNPGAQNYGRFAP